MLADLVALDSVGLSDFEISLLETLQRWDGEFRPKQVRSLKQAWFRNMTEEKIGERLEQWDLKEKAKAAEEPQAAACVYPAGWKGRKI